MRFKTDENLPLFVAEHLRAAGHDVLSVADQQLVGATDSRLASVCHDEGRILVTLDSTSPTSASTRPAPDRG